MVCSHNQVQLQLVCHLLCDHKERAHVQRQSASQAGMRMQATSFAEALQLRSTALIISAATPAPCVLLRALQACAQQLPPQRVLTLAPLPRVTGAASAPYPGVSFCNMRSQRLLRKQAPRRTTDSTPQGGSCANKDGAAFLCGPLLLERPASVGARTPRPHVIRVAERAEALLSRKGPRSSSHSHAQHMRRRDDHTHRSRARRIVTAKLAARKGVSAPTVSGTLVPGVLHQPLLCLAWLLAYVMVHVCSPCGCSNTSQVASESAPVDAVIDLWARSSRNKVVVCQTSWDEMRYDAAGEKHVVCRVLTWWEDAATGAVGDAHMQTLHDCSLLH